MPNVRQLLESRVSAAIAEAYPEAAGAPAIVQAATDGRFGDYQANGAMALAKRLSANPREVAAKIVEQLKGDADLAAMVDTGEAADGIEIAGPGFINFRLKADWVAARLGEVNRVEAGGEDRLGVEPAAEPETVVVDYSAPNLAKEMHVGHLRSTIIGDALVRMLDFAGHNVQRQNHVGDWGTQFGMLLAYRSIALADAREGDAEAAHAYWHSTLGDIEKLYRLAKAQYDSDGVFAGLAKAYVRKLQEGPNPESQSADEYKLRLNVRNGWERLVHLTLEHAQVIYRRLRVTLTTDDARGESAYNDVLPDIVRALEEKGLLTESEGAQCVFLEDANGNSLFANKDGEPLPLIVQKADEGYLYATTDLAAIAFRTGYFSDLPDGSKSPQANRILYVVDARQSLHFQMVFECACQAGFAEREAHELVHVAFGTMMGEDGKPFKTREGGAVKLMDLLDEAERRARDLVERKQAELPEDQPRLSEEEKQEIARKVGIGGVKYADLAQNRTSDYVFSWDKMLSLQGNTAPYMQYAYARVRSIFQKGYPDEAERGRVETDLQADASPLPVADPAEAALGKMLLRLPETLERALADYRPNVLAAYLYDLAQAFTRFYDACPVLKSEEETRRHRLRLCGLTARVIAKGLDLLGIETAERM